MKKISILFYVLIITLCLSSCGKKSETSKNLILQGDFSGEMSRYEGSGSTGLNNNLYQCLSMENGLATFRQTESEELEIDITKRGTAKHSVQVIYDQLKIYKDSKYLAEFDVYGTVERVGEFRIQLNGDPYTNYISEGRIEDKTFQIKTTKTHVKYEFTMKAETDLAPRLCFNIGNFGEKITSEEHKIYLDNLALYCTYDASSGEAESQEVGVLVNQVGYLPNAEKTAVFRGNKLDKNFKIVNAELEPTDPGYEVYSGNVVKYGKNVSSKENVGIATFSDFKTPGKYKIVGKTCGESYVFTIGEDVYDNLLSQALIVLYEQRCGGIVVSPIVNEAFEHDKCHMDEATIYGTTTKIDVSGGWHDAGDYGKYVTPGAKTVADLLLTYQKYGDIFEYPSEIDETKNDIPDILDEAKWELDWMFKMQTSDGGVYHKVSTAEFPKMDKGCYWDKGALIVSPVSYSATADFASCMAMAYCSFKTIDETYANKCLAAAEKAYSFLEANADMEGFKNPSSIKTGEYPDDTLVDEYLWASSELYKATKTAKYLNNFKTTFANLPTTLEAGLGWQEVTYYALYAYLTAGTTSDSSYSSAKTMFFNQLQKSIDNLNADAYNSTIGAVYCWGSNMNIANNGMLYLLAKDIDSTFDVKLANTQLDYLLGENATSYCFVTGYGTLSPVNPHHRPSISSKVCVPGMLIGGPDSDFANNGNDSIATQYLKDVAPAKCYIDNNNSWSCNEMTIYWNSPFIFLVAGVIAGK